MTTYKKAYTSLGVSQAMQAFASGDPKPGYVHFYAPFGDIGFPPAMVPFWSQGSSFTYRGLWWHPFQSRPQNYVNYSISSGYAVVEEARTEEQLVAYLGLELFSHYDEGPHPSINTLYEHFGFCYDEIEHVFNAIGDDISKTAAYVPFSEQTPRAALAPGQKYTGHHPNSMEAASLDEVCTWELAQSTLDTLPPEEQERARNPRPWFDRHVEAGNMKSAWLALNSRGWPAPHGRKALERLANACDDPQLHIVAEAWLSLEQPHGW